MTWQFMKRRLCGLALLALAGLSPAFGVQAGINIDIHQDIQCDPSIPNCPNDFHIEGLICSKNGPPTLLQHIDDLFAPRAGSFSYSITPAGLPDDCWYKVKADWAL